MSMKIVYEMLHKNVVIFTVFIIIVISCCGLDGVSPKVFADVKRKPYWIRVGPESDAWFP